VVLNRICSKGQLLRSYIVIIIIIIIIVKDIYKAQTSPRSKCAKSIFLASVLSGVHAMWPNREECCDWKCCSLESAKPHPDRCILHTYDDDDDDNESTLTWHKS